MAYLIAAKSTSTPGAPNNGANRPKELIKPVLTVQKTDLRQNSEEKPGVTKAGTGAAGRIARAAIAAPQLSVMVALVLERLVALQQGLVALVGQGHQERHQRIDPLVIEGGAGLQLLQ